MRDVITTERDVITTECDVITIVCDVITKVPDVITTECGVITTVSDVIATECDVITTMRDVITKVPDVITTELDVITTECDAITKVPDVITTERDFITTVPDVITTECDAITTERNTITKAYTIQRNDTNELLILKNKKMSGNRINKKDSAFDQYLRNTTTALEGPLPPNPPPPIPAWQRLLLTAAEFAQWLSFRDQWVVVYPKYTDKAQRTQSIINQKNTLKTNFIAFAEPLLNRISGSNALTADERITFNLKERDRSPSSRPVIDTSPSVLLRAKEGRRVQIECRVIADSNRPSKHISCDVIEYRYKVVAPVTIPDPGMPAPPTPPMPGTPAAAQQVLGETGKARFILQLAQGDAGKEFTIECRWKNSKESQKSGPWSAAVSVMVIW